VPDFSPIAGNQPANRVRSSARIRWPLLANRGTLSARALSDIGEERQFRVKRDAGRAVESAAKAQLVLTRPWSLVQKKESAWSGAAIRGRSKNSWLLPRLSGQF